MTSQLSKSGTRNPSQLMPHALNDRIYGDSADTELIESIKQKGILTPLTVTFDDRIISGHRRWRAALDLGIVSVPVVIFGSEDELDIEEALIEANRQRVKTMEQIGREGPELRRIQNERSSRQGTNQYTKNSSDSKEIDNSNKERLDRMSSYWTGEKSASVIQKTEAPRPRNQVAERLGVSHNVLHQAEKVVTAIDTLKASGEEKKAEELRSKLNTGSVKKAYEEAKAIIPAKPKPRTTPKFVTLDQWNQADNEDRNEWINPKGEAKFNETNDNIEWASWSWNPVTGCLHGCDYCYARDIASRFFDYIPGDKFQPAFYPERLTAPGNTRLVDMSSIDDPILRTSKRNVFVCSMADLFGKWVPDEWIEAVLDQARSNPQWNFLFLSKFPIRMADFSFPENTWIGTTVDTQAAVQRAENSFMKIRDGGYKGIAWLSCEPMMESLTFSMLDAFDWVIMGGASKSTRTPGMRPNFEWIVSLWNQAKSFNLPVYMKTNIGIEQRVREYPTRIITPNQ